jgi:hypothetical protein
VSKKRAAQGTKRGSGLISDTKTSNADVSAATGSKKVAVGKTGVELRFYKGPEYAKLTSEQKQELYEHRAKRTDSGKESPRAKVIRTKSVSRMMTPSKKWVAAAVQQQLDKQQGATKDATEAEDEMRRYILSVVSGTKTPPKESATTSAAKAAEPPISL